MFWDRPKFGKRLLDDALKAGVEFRGGVQALIWSRNPAGSSAQGTDRWGEC